MRLDNNYLESWTLETSPQSELIFHLTISMLVRVCHGRLIGCNYFNCAINLLQPRHLSWLWPKPYTLSAVLTATAYRDCMGLGLMLR
jgi:hypothetical protein